MGLTFADVCFVFCIATVGFAGLGILLCLVGACV